jgi:hypothetical protein
MILNVDVECSSKYAITAGRAKRHKRINEKEKA